MKYRTDLPVRDISHILFKEASSIESLLKAKLKKYQEISAEAKKLSPKVDVTFVFSLACDNRGSLIGMDVSFLVEEADLVESEMMENVFFVPKYACISFTFLRQKDHFGSNPTLHSQTWLFRIHPQKLPPTRSLFVWCSGDEGKCPEIHRQCCSTWFCAQEH